MNREGFIPKPRVFISYARKDGEEFAANLRKRLQEEEPEITLWQKNAELKLREKLENRNCLLVIDDVWQRPRLEPFLQGGKQTCARLITTRRLDLVMDARRSMWTK